jgi:hypothetical protein
VFLDFEELILMTSFADYYRALPALSRSLYRVFAQKLFWVSDCDAEEISKVLNAAIKLLQTSFKNASSSSLANGTPSLVYADMIGRYKS